ncbi:MAG: SUMF1/EgtB/PvdO family nonheme iron enzyme [Ardenticatenaceae bacterium]|nr:SUMF1/EgtB/PvdO family nonheme iron enzyme [Ardenticatenaceae bacterium]
MPLLPGEILNTRYRIVHLLSAGTYGCTYRARDIVDGRDVAIKEYLDPAVETQKRFRAEARRLSELQHPQLTAVLDHFALEDVGQYLVSAYVDGVDLQSLLVEYGPLPSDLVIVWLQAVCKPLAYLHEKGQLHLDIKPANVRLTPTGEVFLVDSGLPGLGVRPHAPGYGAPEQQARQEVTPASDIYSLGATLYALLTNTQPPNALSRESGLEDLKPAREVNPNVEPYLSIVANRAMSLRPDVRYETAVDFARALERPSGHPAPEISNLRRTPDPQLLAPALRPAPPRRRRQIERRTTWALLILLLIVVGIGATVSLVNLNAANETVGEAEATATVESAVVAALTAIAPTPSPLPRPTELPTPTPQPFITETGSRMLYVPSGTFRMGDDEGERDERPSRMVQIDAFFIDETEVTVGQYAQCVEAGACREPRVSSENYYGNPSFVDYPVIFVNWYDAETFCEWREARLPSEAEWEMAASYDTVENVRYRFPWGDVFDGNRLNFCDANCTHNSRDPNYDDGYRYAAPVGTYPDGRSPLGAYDMAGNVVEWIRDWYGFSFYREGEDTNPFGPAEGDFKVVRGGSWLATADEVETSARGSFDPLVAQSNVGFRCAMPPP